MKNKISQSKPLESFYTIKGYERNNGVPVLVIKNVSAWNEEDAVNKYVHMHPCLNLVAIKTWPLKIKSSF